MIFYKKKIIISPIGGIGNQIFQFLFGKYLSKVTNRELLISNIHFKVYKKFSPSIKNIFDNKLINTISDIKFVYYKYFNKSITFEEDFLFKSNSKLIDQIKKNPENIIFVRGYFQNLKLYQYDPNFIDLFNIKIKSNNYQNNVNKTPIALHIRRGDYYDDKKVRKVHGILSDQYFVRSISYFNKLFNNQTKFFIFSDDLDYISKIDYLKYIETEFISDSDPVSSFVKLSNFQNYIISNSTFSLLASFISSRKNNLINNICVPKIWHNTTLFEDTYLFINDPKIKFNIVEN